MPKLLFVFVAAMSLAGAGCSFMVGGQDDGRPCTPEGECPTGQVCTDGVCLVSTDPPPPPEVCQTDADCNSECAAGTQVATCAADKLSCNCLVFGAGRIEGVGVAPAAGKFQIHNGRLNTFSCATNGTYTLCGGMTQ